MMFRFKLLALVIALSLLVWTAALLIRIQQNSDRIETNTQSAGELCLVLHNLIARSGATIGKPGTPGYAYYQQHPDELEVARQQNEAFLNRLPCKPPGAATRTLVTPRWPLHVGSRDSKTDKRVTSLQWLLTGHEPSKFKAIHVRKKKPTGQFGKRTAKQVRAAKWLLGYPKPGINGDVGRTLFDYLLGKKARPLGYIGRASKRIIALQEQKRGPPCARRIVAIARHELGVHEIPAHSNWSPRINGYQAVTRQFWVAWCVSFVQWDYLTAGIGTFADRTAGVFYAVDWARRHGWLHSRPRMGAAVAYLRSLGHMGIVERVTRHGFWTIEGNAGDAVRERWHPLGFANTVFIQPPCVR